MGTIIKDTNKRGHAKGDTVYRAQIYVQGQRESASFDTKDEAREWTSAREHELRAAAQMRSKPTQPHLSEPMVGQPELNERIAALDAHTTPAIDIDKLAAALAEQLRRAIPLSVDLWDFETIGRYLKRNPDSVRTRIACLPDFPKAIRLPSEKGNRAHPLWKAAEVIKWAEGHRDNMPGRPRKA
jgi:hypothetical protein